MAIKLMRHLAILVTDLAHEMTQRLFPCQSLTFILASLANKRYEIVTTPSMGKSFAAQNVFKSIYCRVLKFQVFWDMFLRITDQDILQGASKIYDDHDVRK